MPPAFLSSTDLAISGISLFSAIVAASAVLIAPEETLSEGMLRISHLVQSYFPLAPNPNDTNRMLQPVALFAALGVFWLSQTITYFRRGRTPYSLLPAIILSGALFILGKFNFAEYLLVCVPLSIAIDEMTILISPNR